MRTTRGENGLTIDMLQVSMPGLADALSTFMDRPVVDMTKLKGNYQVVLASRDMDYYVRARAAAKGLRLPPPPGGAADDPGSVATASDPIGGSIFKTLEKLGLKLDRRKAPVEMLVVDHLEKTPTGN
jgi:uncharacterized protein (TIGR03435 family)